VIAPAADGRSVRVRVAAVGPDGLRLTVAAAEAAALAFPGAATVAAPQTGPVVLGHEAVATVLDHLRPAFGVHLDLGGGPLAGRLGARVAAPSVNLSDSCRHPGTLPRSYDAEGVPRRPVPLIQDGVAHRRVHDSASAARNGTDSTGHSTRALALAPMPEHLVLVGGGADDVADLAASVEAGLYIPALSPGREADGDAFRHTTVGAVAIRGGELAAPVADVEVLVDPLAVLASVEALTGGQRLVALRADTPGGLGAAVVPALRARDGVSPG
jgi:PmbA protein